MMDALDDASQAASSDKVASRFRNRTPRVSYRRNLAATIEHPGGGSMKISVWSRNLSVSGIALVGDLFILPGSRCSLALISCEAEQVLVQGRVVHCHLVKGRVHEMGVKFDQAINLASFIPADAMPAIASQPADMQGHVLLLNPSLLEQKLFKHCIHDTRITLKAVGEPPEAVEALRSTSKAGHFDIFVCDMSLSNESPDGISVVREVRDAGFCGPIIKVSSEPDDARITAAKAAGANYIVPKPYTPQAMLAVLQRAHEDSGIVVRPELLVSSRPDQIAIAELLQAFQDEIKAHADGIQKSVEAADVVALRRACHAIKAAADGMGYMNLAAAAEAAVKSLTRPFIDIRLGLLKLASACRAVARAS